MLSSCGFLENGSNSKGKLVGTYKDSELYWGDIKDYFPVFSSKEDSTLHTQKYLNDWLVTQRKLEQARLDSSIDFQLIDRKTQKLKEDLIIHHFHSNYLENNLIRSVSQNELEAYYNSHKNNFILKEKLIKGVFIKLNKSSQKVKEIKKLFNKSDSTSFVKLLNLVEQEATNYDLDKTKWKKLSSFLIRTPFYNSPTHINKLIKNKKATFEKEGNIYLIKFSELKNEKEIAPLETREGVIKNIILNKRKQELLRKLNEQFLQAS